MAYRFFINENIAKGLPKNAPFQAGRSDVDPGQILEKGLTLPWVINPRYSFEAYVMWLECYLDAGLVVHKSLPQVAQPFDTLASGQATDTNLDNNILGVNLISQGSFTDTLQRMATSEYQFVLKGYATRAGYQIPVPGLKTIAGIPAYPGKLQWSLGNPIVANYSGIPIFHNRWELWYVVTVPPKKAQLPLSNLGQHITASVVLPQGMQVPYSETDQNAVASAPLRQVIIP